MNNVSIRSVSVNTYEFRSHLTRGGDPITPENILIQKGVVTWSKNKGWDALFLERIHISIPISMISAVVIHKKFIGADIVIYATGFMNITARHFTHQDAFAIRKLLLNY